MLVHTLEGVFDELEKIAASKREAGYMQARSGRRPIRAHNLIGRDSTPRSSAPNITFPDQVTQDPETEPANQPLADSEEDDAALGKTAAEDAKTKALEGFATARPYVAQAVKAGVPAAVLGGIMGGKRTAKVLGAIGAGAGVTNEALQQWAEKHKRKAIAKKLLED